VHTIVIASMGLTFGIGGITFIGMGVRRSFRGNVDIPDHTAGEVAGT
jgi:hypothetical protein